ncbi:DEKNAAC100195 [Brettanomyces naardenensis]|uniref:DEKNAAC100195 n=1 Tax=Brettanomyces naardenensis TaxID=13370 RepID=A0A448YFL4_BRENA|nr:DEKNAAC100195 [Brettanomyces naardenensis]
MTIAEGDELEDNQGPIFPVFSNSSTQLRLPDESLANEIPYSTAPDLDKQRQLIHQEIENDFDKEFNRDTGTQPFAVPRRVRKQLAEDKPDTDSEYDTDEDENLQKEDADDPKKSEEDGSHRSASPLFTDFRSALADTAQKESVFTETYPLEDLALQDSTSQLPTTHTNLKNDESSSSIDIEQNGRGRRRHRWLFLPDANHSDSDDHSAPPGKRPLQEAQELVDQHVPLSRSNERFGDGSRDALVPAEDDYDEGVMLNDSEDDTPHRVRPGVAAHLLKLYEPGNDQSGVFSDTNVDNFKAEQSPEFEADQKRPPKQKGLGNLLPFRSSSSSLQPMFSNMSKRGRAHKSTASDFEMPSFKRGQSAERKTRKFDLRRRFRGKRQRANAARVTVHIADIIQRQRFVLTLCKAFMGYGAPNHRLEEYLKRTSRVLEIDASFVYFPDIIIVSFGDPSTKTSEMKIVRVSQGFNLAKLDDAHEIYKAVVHDRLGVEEASQKLDDLLNGKSYFNQFWLITFYGLSSAFIIIWFNGSWTDLGPSFIMGCIVGFFQLVLAPKSTLYSSVFEVGSSILLSFLGRAVGSIGHGKIFCFSAIVQSGLAMILPGYTILCGALEIQSRSIVSGTVRMFYAIIYSLLLGFGITLGSALYGWIDKNAVTSTTCSTPGLAPAWNFLFIPAFTIFATLGVGARWSQLFVMVLIASGGYAVDYFSAKHFGIAQFNAALGAFTIGLLSNLYSRFGMPFRKISYCSSAFTAMYPGIIDLVPGSVASRNVLAAGITQLSSAKGANSSSETGNILSDSTLTFGITMIEVSIGISVGLFLSAIFVYPFGKKTTGIFSL